MLLRHSLGLQQEADAVEAAISAAIRGGARTADIAADGDTPVSTTAMTDLILAELG
jgi:3-isopropylmalate dehydrogenase